MSSFMFTFFTENQNQKKKAEKLASVVCSSLQEIEVVKTCEVSEIIRYYKIENSYKIIIAGQFCKDTNMFEASIKATNQIASQWSIQFCDYDNIINLYFTKQSAYLKNVRFNVITFAEFTTLYA